LLEDDKDEEKQDEKQALVFEFTDEVGETLKE